MGYLVLPVIIGILAFPDAGAGPGQLADFSRLRSAIDEEVYVVDASGLERRLRLIEAGTDAIRLAVAQQTVELTRDQVVRVERAHDRSTDGAVKGALLGGLAGMAVAQAVPGGARYVLRGAVVYGALGFLFDRANVARQTVYKK